MHKVLMTGLLVIVGRGSALQPIVALCFQLAYLFLITKSLPYRNDDDDMLSLISALTICVTALGALLMITSDSNKSINSVDTATVGNFIFVVSLIAITIEISILTRQKLRKRKRKCCADRCHECPRRWDLRGCSKAKEIQRKKQQCLI